MNSFISTKITLSLTLFLLLPSAVLLFQHVPLAFWLVSLASHVSFLLKADITEPLYLVLSSHPFFFPPHLYSQSA